MAIDPDWAEKVLIFGVEWCGISDPVCVLQCAAQSQRKAPVLGLLTENRSVCGSADCKKPLACWHFHKLRKDDSGHAERSVNVPDRACAAIFGKVKACRVESFGHISRFVDPEKEERHAARAFALQGRDAVCHLLERDVKGSCQSIKIVFDPFGFFQEGQVGH